MNKQELNAFASTLNAGDEVEVDWGRYEHPTTIRGVLWKFSGNLLLGSNTIRYAVAPLIPEGITAIRVIKRVDPGCPFEMGAKVRAVKNPADVGVVESWRFRKTWGRWMVRVDSGAGVYGIYDADELELIPEPARPEPKFKRGYRVQSKRYPGRGKTVGSVEWRENSGNGVVGWIVNYAVGGWDLEDNVALAPAPRPEPKFKVGDRMHCPIIHDKDVYEAITEVRWELGEWEYFYGNGEYCTRHCTLAPTDDEVVASLREHEWVTFDHNGLPKGPHCTYNIGGILDAGCYIIRFSNGTRSGRITNVRRVPAPVVQ